MASKPEVHREVRELSLLFEVSQTLDTSLDLGEVVDPVLERLTRHTGMTRATLTLFDPYRHELLIETAFGLSSDEQDRGRYRLGEGITGRVVKSGEPAIVPRVSEEPAFLDRTEAHDREATEASFVCVAVKLGNEVIGALSAMRPFDSTISLEEDARLLAIIASMIAQAVKLRLDAQIERQALEEENPRLQEELRDRYKPSNIVGNSKKMRLVYDLIGQVAASDTTALLRGESGTGKELVAQAIHYASQRSEKPFIRVNLAALPEAVIESELFGHERGAFTGATTLRKGRFELAHGGTIFLDEIGDLSPSMQIKLLRVLQERDFERVGGVVTLETDVRVIAATNRDLEALLETGGFRQDLYYRLNVFPIHLPPLRERRTDIPLLADHFTVKYAERMGKEVKRISTPSIDMLMSYHWPGNVRELENCIERAVLLANHGVIHPHHLPPTLQTAETSGTQLPGGLKIELEAVERGLILDALKSTRGNMARASKQLSISERIMGLRVKKYGISPRHFRTEM